jgi:hypothetical protein
MAECSVASIARGRAVVDEVPHYIQEIFSYANDLYPIMWDREKYPDHPSEDELIAHLVVPFLRALDGRRKI